MANRDHIHPLALAALYSRDAEDWKKWADADYPLLTQRASAVLLAAERNILGFCSAYPRRECDKCDAIWECGWCEEIRKAWEENEESEG